MRTLKHILVLIVLSMLLLPVTLVAAQDADVSEGCAALDGVTAIANPAHAFVVYSFAEGDTIRVAVAGTGTQFALREAGSVVVGPVPVGSSLAYVVPAAGDYLFSVEVTGSAADTQTTVSCTPAAADDDDGGGIVIPRSGNVTLCHYPPGNPLNAHTITVGAPAASTHVNKHGDTLGACPASVNTRYDDFDSGTVVIVVPQTGDISVWGECEGESCAPVISISVTQITIVNTVINIDGGAHFVVVGDSDDVRQVFDDDDDDAYYAVLYYLHPDPADPTIGVFQINLYLNNTLINDQVLLFIDLDGGIVRWTTHQFWVEQVEEADDDGDD